DADVRAARGADRDAAGPVARRAERHELAVLGDPALELLHGVRAVARRLMLALPVAHHVDGRLRLLGEARGRDALDARAELGAEAAAHVLGDDVDVAHVDLEVA